MADSLIQLVAFDLGGVLAHVDKRVDQCFFEGSPFELFTIGRISSSEFFKRVAIHTPKTVNQLEREFLTMVSPISELEDLLASLKRPFTVWSNINQSHFAHLLKCSSALRRYELPSAGLSFQLNLKKPNKKFYQACLEAINLRPDQVLFFDDDSRNVQGAREIGINAHQVSSYHSLISKLKGESLLA